MSGGKRSRVAASASPEIEAFASEPFAVGAIDDSPIVAADRMRWTVIGTCPDGRGGALCFARASGGREMRIEQGAAGCRAWEVRS